LYTSMMVSFDGDDGGDVVVVVRCLKRVYENMVLILATTNYVFADQACTFLLEVLV